MRNYGLLAALALVPVRAQVVNDGATNTLSNVTTNITGDVTVGTNGSLTTTNVTIPIASWFVAFVGQFNSGGGFSFTDSITPGEPARPFRVRMP